MTGNDIKFRYVTWKLKRRMIHVLKTAYMVDVKSLSKEKVFGRTSIERLLDLYMIGYHKYSFEQFHEAVKPICMNQELMNKKWSYVLKSDGTLR